jgi:dGTPase
MGVEPGLCLFCCLLTWQATAKSCMTTRLIPEQFVGPNRVPFSNAYTRLLRLTDYISGMTDSYAVSLYKQITGISLPGG